MSPSRTVSVINMSRTFWGAGYLATDRRSSLRSPARTLPDARVK
ncbi:MAG: hypothetical protein OXU63_06620 [Acidobacteriota bacterium]|nr:hypothetical protein [Acidobacteriota bacterium]